MSKIKRNGQEQHFIPKGGNGNEERFKTEHKRLSRVKNTSKHLIRDLDEWNGKKRGRNKKEKKWRKLARKELYQQ